MRRTIEAALERLWRSIEKRLPWGKPSKPDNSNPWRDGRDMDTIIARDDCVEFETRDILKPPGPNLPGDSEWIIARVEGAGFSRLLITTMDTSGGRRSPSRIFFDGAMIDGRYPVPDPGPTAWRITGGDALRVYRDNTLIFEHKAPCGIRHAIMTGYARRGFLGQWRAVNA